MEEKGVILEPIVLHFLDDDFLVITHLEYDDSTVVGISYTAFVYETKRRHLVMLPTTEADASKAKDILWRKREPNILELNEKGRWNRYAPTSIDEMQRHRVPREYFETWCKSFADQGRAYSLTPQFPDFARK